MVAVAKALLGMLGVVSGFRDADMVRNVGHAADVGTEDDFQIFAKVPGAGLFVLRVKATDTINEVKEKIFAKSGMPTYAQRLVCQGTPVHAGKLSDFSKIGKDATLEVYAQLHSQPAPSGGTRFPIFVRHSADEPLNGKLFTLLVEPSDTVASVKAKIVKLMSSGAVTDPRPSHELCLTSRGPEGQFRLTDENTLEDYGIHRWSTLDLE
uniref:Ubiquitin-like domain-containing protein n=1 Tax=Zooxanthella nutricula TaxID=1333877 RepID=A0A6U6MYB2_9DINO|mmetsp:Transcript_44090/g.133580  ORF Transcript_44090/g.133580 Transcript_44090/m.133580 type:complete len:209 (+) Transcript_44090:113-739(+)